MPPKRKKAVLYTETSAKKAKNTEDNISSMQKYFKSALSCEASLCKYSDRKCEEWFYKYADENKKFIGPVGIERLCKDLQVEPEDVVTLVIAWKLGAESMGYFKLNEWKNGMASMECDNIIKLKSMLSSLRDLLKDGAQFKKIYRYAFDFSRDKDQKSLDITTAKAMLLLLLNNSWSLISDFIEFLNQSKYKIINRDQWNSLLEFIRTVSSSDFSKYDETGAWPVMLDEFVQWYLDKTKMS
uniref:Defective in cullin neddylation protein n=1 Tax=Hydra vulgaris TaxID=6087 RepID=T2M8B4_HYDVU|nr:DCN1-like protein 4 [Hydra vulgaris]